MIIPQPIVLPTLAHLGMSDRWKSHQIISIVVSEDLELWFIYADAKKNSPRLPEIPTSDLIKLFSHVTATINFHFPTKSP